MMIDSRALNNYPALVSRVLYPVCEYSSDLDTASTLDINLAQICQFYRNKSEISQLPT